MKNVSLIIMLFVFMAFPVRASETDFRPKEICEKTLIPGLKKVKEIVTRMEAMRLKLGRVGIELTKAQLDEQSENAFNDLKKDKPITESAILQSFCCAHYKELASIETMQIKKHLKHMQASQQFLVYYIKITSELPKITKQMCSEREERIFSNMAKILHSELMPQKKFETLSSIKNDNISIYISNFKIMNAMLDTVHTLLGNYHVHLGLYMLEAKEASNSKSTIISHKS